MTESELQQRIAELEAQNLALVEENKKLREALGLPSEIIVAPIQEPSFTIITSPEESFDEDSISIIRKSNLYQKYVIIDERIVWYGNIGLLSYWESEESIMRLESRELAEELKAMS
jgi:hypothetical protein